MPTNKKVKKVNIERLRKEAEKLIKNGDYTMRSCWNCNGAHEHLKDCDIPLTCFGCGDWYFKGVNLMEKSPHPTNKIKRTK